MNLAQKKSIVAEVAVHAGEAVSVVAVDYRGLKVSEITALRMNARQAQVYLVVVRNTLARQAFTGTSFECMKDVLVGPVMLAFSKAEPSAAARLLRDFAKTNEKLKVKALSLGGELYDGKHLEAIAKLPTRIEGIARLLGVMQAPVSQFVRTMAEPLAQLVRVLAAVRDQKQ